MNTSAIRLEARIIEVLQHLHEPFRRAFCSGAPNVIGRGLDDGGRLSRIALHHRYSHLARLEPVLDSALNEAAGAVALLDFPKLSYCIGDMFEGDALRRIDQYLAVTHSTRARNGSHLFSSPHRDSALLVSRKM